MREPFHSFPVVEGKSPSLEEAVNVAKGDVGVVADMRPEKNLERQCERAGGEEDDAGPVSCHERVNLALNSVFPPG